MTQIEDLKEIRTLMERSTRFLSLSGLSGIFAGLFALIGAFFAWWYINQISSADMLYVFDSIGLIANPIIILMVDGLLVFVFALSAGVYFSMRKAKKQGVSFWSSPSKRLLINFLIPIIAGAFFCLFLIIYGFYIMIVPASLMFYGLALVNASKYTYNTTLYFGLSEIVLGILSAIFVGYGIWFWAIGFGVLHIMYGTIIYFIYDNGTANKQAE